MDVLHVSVIFISTLKI